jgi:hypothetical protein
MNYRYAIGRLLLPVRFKAVYLARITAFVADNKRLFYPVQLPVWQ